MGNFLYQSKSNQQRNDLKKIVICVKLNLKNVGTLIVLFNDVYDIFLTPMSRTYEADIFSHFKFNLTRADPLGLPQGTISVSKRSVLKVV